MSAQKKPAQSIELSENILKADVAERIRQRAYEIYETRGREDGRELEHWLEAEAEIRDERVRSVAA